MRRHRFLLFPAGAPGAGLLLLRLSVTIFLATYPAGRFAKDDWQPFAFYLLAFAIGTGLRTRSAATIAMILAVVAFAAGGPDLNGAFIAHAIDALVLAIVGPGAFSLDARLFGRTTVRLPD